MGILSGYKLLAGRTSGSWLSELKRGPVVTLREYEIQPLAMQSGVLRWMVVVSKVRSASPEW